LGGQIFNGTQVGSIVGTGITVGIGGGRVGAGGCTTITVSITITVSTMTTGVEVDCGVGVRVGRGVGVADGVGDGDGVAVGVVVGDGVGVGERVGPGVAVTIIAVGSSPKGPSGSYTLDKASADMVPPTIRMQAVMRSIRIHHAVLSPIRNSHGLRALAVPAEAGLYSMRHSTSPADVPA
jgi:hypothetical protein